jgi:hypothetical protein
MWYELDWKRKMLIIAIVLSCGLGLNTMGTEQWRPDAAVMFAWFIFVVTALILYMCFDMVRN